MSYSYVDRLVRYLAQLSPRLLVPAMACSCVSVAGVKLQRKSLMSDDDYASRLEDIVAHNVYLAHVEMLSKLLFPKNEPRHVLLSIQVSLIVVSET